MKDSNINELSKLIIEKEKQYIFRMLEKKDAYEVTILMTNAFLYYNPAFQIFQVKEEDIKTLYTPQLFDSIIIENFSFGAFYENKLVSASLAYNLWPSDQSEPDQMKPTQAIQGILDMNSLLLGKYADPQNFKQKEIVNLSHLATHQDYFNQNLALSCAYLSVQECRKQGFQQMITQAEHPGTYQIFKKIFKNFEIIKQLDELKGQPANVISVIGSLSPY